MPRRLEGTIFFFTTGGHEEDTEFTEKSDFFFLNSLCLSDYFVPLVVKNLTQRTRRFAEKNYPLCLSVFVFKSLSVVPWR